MYYPACVAPLCAMSKALTKLVTRSSDGLVCHDHAALEQQHFNVAQAQLEAEISSNRAAGDLSGKTVTVIARIRFLHRAILSDRPRNLTTPASAVVAVLISSAILMWHPN
ncbi:hypothetical protein LMG28727_01355 [Paraburkholderia kirstenboschensis]|nr:hypothetical protein LMG28727_01355 [Paraburkholderia kirstenboschensis]